MKVTFGRRCRLGMCHVFFREHVAGDGKRGSGSGQGLHELAPGLHGYAP